MGRPRSLPVAAAKGDRLDTLLWHLPQPADTSRDIPRIFHAGRTATLNIGSELRKRWCAILAPLCVK